MSTELNKNTEGKDFRQVQKTLDGGTISTMPKVRTTNGYMMEWDRNEIVRQLMKETPLAERFYGVPGITKEEAVDIARDTESRVRKMNLEFLSGPLVREIGRAHV